MKSYIAKQIDEEYKRKQMFKKKQREKCVQVDCNECKYKEICDNAEVNDEV